MEFGPEDLHKRFRHPIGFGRELRIVLTRFRGDYCLMIRIVKEKK